MKPMSPLSERPIASHLLHVMVAVSMLLVSAQTAEAQKPKLKLLEYNHPEDSLIFCGSGPYYVEDTVQVIPGVLVDEGQIYCHDCWGVYVRELSVSNVADEFRRHIGDTVTIAACEFLPDSSRAVLQRLENDLGACRLRRSAASANPMVPTLYYDIIFSEPTKFGRVDEYIRAMDIDRETVLGVVAEGPCLMVHTSVEEELKKIDVPTRIAYGGLRITEPSGQYILLDVRGRVVSDLQLQPGVYFLLTVHSRQRILVLP